MAFGVDYSKADSSNPIPEGEYEAIIRSVGEDTTKGGTVYISVPLVVRNDVEQPRQNAYIWHSIWKKREPAEADLACGGYVAWQIQALSKAVGLPNGKKYESLDDWFKDLACKPVRVAVKHEEYNGRTNAKVQYVGPSKFPECTHVFKNDERFEEVEEDGDLPF